MPLGTLTVRRPKSGAFKSAAPAAVHAALDASGVPEQDRFHRVLDLDAEDFRFDTAYPDLSFRRNNDFVLIEILFSTGRSVKVKRKLVADIMAGLARDPGADAENVMVCFKETQWENWSFGGGLFIHV